MKIAERFTRWRASRGYGVHSPLAFRLVKNVVRPPRDVVYYGEERLSDAFRASAEEGVRDGFLSLRRARLLLRLVADLQPSYVWMSPGTPPLFADAVRAAGCVIRIYDGALYPDYASRADLTVLFGEGLKKDQLRECLEPGKALAGFGLEQAFIREVGEIMSGGVLIEGVTGLIAISTADSDLHFYRVSPF